MSNFEKVKEFHEKFGGDINVDFTPDNIDLRRKLMMEELNEVEEELIKGWNGPDDLVTPAMGFKSSYIDKVKLSKELADLLYVVYGAAVTYGLPIDEVFAEVHKSNMSKLGADGKPIYREDGKILKGPNYAPPDLTKFFNKE